MTDDAQGSEAARRVTRRRRKPPWKALTIVATGIAIGTTARWVSPPVKQRPRLPSLETLIAPFQRRHQEARQRAEDVGEEPAEQEQD